MFSDKYLSFSLQLVDRFPKFVPNAFGPFIGYHQGLLACEINKKKHTLHKQATPDDGL